MDVGSSPSTNISTSDCEPLQDKSVLKKVKENIYRTDVYVGSIHEIKNIATFWVISDTLNRNLMKVVITRFVSFPKVILYLAEML